MSVSTKFGLEELSKLFSVVNSAKVLSFLELRHALASTLIEAHDKIKTYFPDSRLFLEYFIDPESESNSHLVIWIDTDLEINETINRLYKLDEEWTYNLSDDVITDLSINLGSR